jgi:hypothetical protein
MLLIGLALEGIVLLTVRRGWREVLEEGGWVESFQVFVLVMSLFAVLSLAYRHPFRRFLTTLTHVSSA